MRLQSLLRSKTLVEQVYDRVLDAICSGTLGPEEHITQDGLADSLQVSRQPVITALGQLKQQGFLVLRPAIISARRPDLFEGEPRLLSHDEREGTGTASSAGRMTLGAMAPRGGHDEQRRQ